MAIPALEGALAADFAQHFGSRPIVVRAPGRLTLLGKHSEAYEGLVLPAALDKYMVVGVALNDIGRVRLYAYDTDVAVESSLAAIQPNAKSWVNRLLSVAAGFERLGLQLPGFDCMFGGNIPVGSGLSTVAAVASGLAYALNKLLGTRLSRIELAHLAQQAEQPDSHQGITDYVTSLCSRPNHLLRLDCQSSGLQFLPVEAAAYRLVLLDAGVSRSRAEAGYAVRQQECAEGLAVLRRHFPGLRSLRDATPMHLHRYRQEMGENVYRRCAFVLAENHRVDLAAHHLQSGNLRAFGQQMYASHTGLRHEYGVSCPELDDLVQMAQDFPAVLGARMLGGLTSCTLNLVPTEAVPEFLHHASAAYERRWGSALFTYQAGIGEGLVRVA